MSIDNLPPPDGLRAAGNDAPLPIAPALGSLGDASQLPRTSMLISRRVLLISLIAVLLGIAAAWIADLLTALIGLVTNLAFYGRWSTAFSSPADHHLGAWVIVVPVIGGLIVGVMARWGSQAIRGHGIPEAMEQVLLNESKIAPRITFLKPISSAIAIGSGGPFGAEGPIIATGGALGSFFGQLLRVTASERKVLLAAGAAAGMAAVFASPLAALILAVELLLFELRASSLIPVALAAFSATTVRYGISGDAAGFAMPAMPSPGAEALVFYVLLGALIGVISIAVTHIVYGIEDAFAKLPIHWMWWPAIGGVAVGVIGWIAPLTLGVGYTNIEAIVTGHLAAGALAMLCLMKFLSWSIALGSGTSGGTLAPLFTIGGALGALAGIGIAVVAPSFGVDPRMAALVGMAAIFVGASRALLTSIVFALETTHAVSGLLPLLGGCTAAYLVSCLCMRNTIMTEKIARRGVRVPSEYAADYLEQVLVRDAMCHDVVTLKTSDELTEVRQWLLRGAAEAQHQGYPVLDETGHVRGVVTRRDLLNPDTPGLRRIGDMLHRKPIIVHETHSLREAADHMVAENVGRLIVVGRDAPHPMLGILTRGDVLGAHARRLRESRQTGRHLRVRHLLRLRRDGDASH
ncbi:MAG TPA: chloride channel protein [Rhodanobacteraceae bacterium]|nr:chloride channel protein [Rhodanobacteraceae bacterium]